MRQGKATSSTKHTSLRRYAIHQSGQAMLIVSGISLLMAIAVVAWSVAFPRTSWAELENAESPPASGQTMPLPTPTNDASKPLIGIVAGHAGYDPGAVCDDGLTEAEINNTVALIVVDLLHRKGVETDLLEEYDSRLKDYRADALVSIHADSCNIPGTTGFKVARVTDSAIPAAEDKLVACLTQEYAAATGLPLHSASITDGMTNYHAFNEIASSTPGAIIETGFMLDDRRLLENRPIIVARGIASGILCFLNAQAQ
jgi:N-acetylmuramoyl-L-alanine amidase